MIPVFKFSGELLVTEKLAELIRSQLTTKESQEIFLAKSLNEAVEKEYPGNVFDIDITVS